MIHPLECLVLAVLAFEQNGAAPFNADDRAISELDGAVNPRIQLGEGGSRTGHVVGGPRVEDPTCGLPLAPVAELNEELVLVDVDRSGVRRCRR